MASSNRTPSVKQARFKPTPDLAGALSRLEPGKRSEYIRAALHAYREQHPAITAIPMDEPVDVVVLDKPMGFESDRVIVAWLAQIPAHFRSYLIRCCLRSYLSTHPISAEPKPDQLVLKEALA